MQIFEIFECSCENLSNSSCHFWKHKSVFLQMLHQYSMPPNITPLYFFRSNFIYFVQKKLIKVQIFETFECSRQIPHVNFELTSKFLFKFCFILHFHGIKLPYKFWAHTFSTLDKRIPSKSQFLDFPVFWWNFPEFLMSFWRHESVFDQVLHQSSVPSNITPLYFI